MAPGSPKPVEDLEDVGPGDMANYGLALDGDQQAEFEIEEEQVLQGLALLFTEKVQESEQFFEELKTGNARLTLHHAEVSALKALVGFEQEDIERAISLLSEAYNLATQAEKQKRTHSKVAKVKGFFQWATGQRGRAGSEAEARMEGTEKAGDTAARLQRQRRQRLRALTVQAEADLVLGLLHLVGGGELSSQPIKAGFYLRRAWSEYAHCQSKLEQVLRDYAVMKGLQAGPDMDDERLAEKEREIGGDWSDEEGEPADSKKTGAKASATVVPIEAAPKGTDGEEAQDDFGDFAAAAPSAQTVAAGLARLDLRNGGAGSSEDPELVSLRAGIQFGVGMLHCVMSMLPPAVLRSLEWVGVAGIDRKLGLKLLQQCAATHTGHATLAAYAQLHYRSVIMGFLPRSEAHSSVAAATLTELAAPFRESTLFGMAQVRALRYSAQLAAATALAQQEPRRAPIECLHLRRHRLHEQAWCTLLRGDMETAATMFGGLATATKSGYRKTFYTAFQISCLWESGPRHYAAAAGLLRDSVPFMKATSTPIEAYVINMAAQLNATDSRPLFPARELLAYWNGFQAMDAAALEAHIRVVEEALHTRCQDVGAAAPGDDEPADEAVASGILAAANGRPTASVPGAAPQKKTKAGFGHVWSERSKMLCRFLLGVLQRHAGQAQRAEDGLRYVVAAGNVEQLPNILPYAAYELGSLLMTQPATAGEGVKLLEKAVAFPPHDFQGRLKFVVAERVNAYFERKE
ncbi:hypothetical protein KFL_000970210 [Klebsormidium nitens]|uniref:Uncharacterized protein n=1 Tax=Klebsormidium nitens TaxID=105231 RepID=A0A0U9HK34_KLENI|nr:hypothetical protein KFL_000970210 [Klebsormidium nitens]|eukprot:GAQ81995.1 hypothetical protein KFL_000970210 [Klebsormidium nitens]